MTACHSQLPAAVRTLIFAVDASDDDIDDALMHRWDQTSVAELGEVVEALASAAIQRRGLADDCISVRQAPVMVATGFVFAALRVEHSTPFASGDDSYRRQTNVDVTQPLAQNPGGSAILSRLRSLFQTQICELFDHDQSLRQCAAQVVLSTAEEPIIASNNDCGGIPEVTLGSASNGVSYVRLPEETATSWARFVPQTAADEEFPAIRRADEYVFVPIAVLRAKLREYAGHSFDRLVHRGFHTFRDWRQHALKEESWGIEKAIHDKYRTNRISSIYGRRRYDTGGPSTQSAASKESGFQPTVHDHQLTNIVDVIRGSDTLAFDEFNTAREIYDSSLTYYPPPHRPSNTLRSVQRVAQVLQSAAETDGSTTASVERRERQDNGQTVAEYRVTEPRYSPIYTCRTDQSEVHRWAAYRRLRAQCAARELPDETHFAPAVRSEAGTASDPLVNATRRAHALAATQPHCRPLDAIDAAKRPGDLAVDIDLSQAELLALTRIVYALNGLIRGRTLVDGMNEYTQTAAGDVAEQLCSKGVLEAEEEPYQTLYSVSSSERVGALIEALDIGTVSNEGYAEQAGESVLHRYGTALLALALGERDGVAEVRRYVDLWRFDLDAALERARAATEFRQLEGDSLHQRRLDVVAVDDDGIPMFAGEVQLDHGKPNRVRRNWEKLRVLAERDASALWMSLDFPQLATILRTLQREDCLADCEFPSTETVGVWQSFFENNGLYTPGLAEFHTYRSLYREVDSL